MFASSCEVFVISSIKAACFVMVAFRKVALLSTLFARLRIVVFVDFSSSIDLFKIFSAVTTSTLSVVPLSCTMNPIARMRLFVACTVVEVFHAVSFKDRSASIVPRSNRFVGLASALCFLTI